MLFSRETLSRKTKQKRVREIQKLHREGQTEVKGIEGNRVGTPERAS